MREGDGGLGALNWRCELGRSVRTKYNIGAESLARRTFAKRGVCVVCGFRTKRSSKGVFGAPLFLSSLSLLPLPKQRSLLAHKQGSAHSTRSPHVRLLSISPPRCASQIFLLAVCARFSRLSGEERRRAHSLQSLPRPNETRRGPGGGESERDARKRAPRPIHPGRRTTPPTRP